MRLVAKFEEKDRAKLFLTYLEQEKCSGLIEHEANSYLVWIYDEDQLDLAKKLYEKFKQPEFKEEIKSDKIVEEQDGPIPISDDPIFLAQMQDFRKKILAKALYQHFNSKVTRFFVVLCAVLLMFNVVLEIRSGINQQQQPITALEQLMFYDYPIQQGKKTGWQGYYSILEELPESKSKLNEPKFVAIKKGEFWRIFTPCLLHIGLIHLLFNMIWFWIFGKQIEERISRFRYLTLLILLGSFSNTVQYLFSGPNFMGFSGIICGLAGFVWMRQKIAPWEGYPIPKNTMNFLFIFIYGIAFVQLVAFLLNYFEGIHLPINIANSAHLSGLFFGAFLGRTHLFDRRKK